MAGSAVGWQSEWSAVSIYLSKKSAAIVIEYSKPFIMEMPCLGIAQVVSESRSGWFVDCQIFSRLGNPCGIICPRRAQNGHKELDGRFSNRRKSLEVLVHPGRLERPACGFEVSQPTCPLCSIIIYNLPEMYALQRKTIGVKFSNIPGFTHVFLARLHRNYTEKC